MNAAELKDADDKQLPISYHWNRSQAHLSMGGAAVFAVMAGVAYAVGGADTPDADKLCVPENAECHRYVEDKAMQDRLFLSGIFLFFGSGVALSRASRFYERAVEIQQKHEGPNII